MTAPVGDDLSASSAPLFGLALRAVECQRGAIEDGGQAGSCGALAYGASDDDDGAVDFKDFAELAKDWLEVKLWPE